MKKGEEDGKDAEAGNKDDARVKGDELRRDTVEAGVDHIRR